MKTHKLEQLLHGYRRGHEQLAGSVKLPARDAELITRLSDLSGSLAAAPKFASYLTVYPLPSGEYFALGRTWPDPDAARAGCVLTHTLLVPVPVWARLAEPRVLEGLFTFPSSRSTGEYASAVAIPPRVTIESSRIDGSAQNVLLTFVHRYFGQGKRPIVWFGQERPEEVLWRLLRGLWPKLRATFSACTFCLQPRTLEDRPFELMFAPSEVYPRFLKMRPDHFIDATSSVPTVQATDNVEQWHRAWAKQLFWPVDQGKPPTDPELWAELDEDPTSVRRLFLIEALTEGVNPTPQVFVGAMDLVESVAKSAESAVGSKRRVAERAVQAARDVGDPANGLECLLLIEDRLSRTSFSGVQETVGPVLLDAIASLTQKFPEVTAQSPLLLAADSDLNASWVGKGLLQGFRTLAHDNPDKLLVLRKVPGIVRHLLTAEPEVGAAFIGATAARRDDPDTRAELLRWLEDVRDYELRRALRASLVSMLGSDDVDILAEILKDLRAEEVGVTLDALWRQTNQFEENAQYIIDGALDFGGRLDLLVVCAGAALIKPLPEVSLAEWEHVFAMNARSVFLTNRAALGPMLAGGRGLIVNVASRAGITGAPNVTVYTAAKAAVIGFSRALAMEVKPKGIRVACIAPGPMDTPMRWAATPDFDPARLISTDAVADLIVYLARRADVTLDDPVVPVSIRL